jgi:ribose 5-phosphate isomerase B
MAPLFIGSDHRGFCLKEKIKEWLIPQNYQLEDIGNKAYNEDDDFSDFAIKLGEKVVQNNGLGILLCANGIGVNIAVNKVKGIRGAICFNEKQVRTGVNDDNLNVLCIPSDYISFQDCQKIVTVFLTTVFSPQERFVRRLNKIKEYESATS